MPWRRGCVNVWPATFSRDAQRSVSRLTLRCASRLNEKLFADKSQNRLSFPLPQRPGKAGALALSSEFAGSAESFKKRGYVGRSH